MNDELTNVMEDYAIKSAQLQEQLITNTIDLEHYLEVSNLHVTEVFAAMFSLMREHEKKIKYLLAK